MQNHAKVGGVLSIVAGGFGILALLFFVLIAVVMLIMHGRFGNDFDYNSMAPEGFFAVMAAFYVIVGIFQALVGALAIVGGVFALRKKHWGWALAGAIAGAVTFFPCGIPAIIFISLGKPEFQTAAPVPPAPTAPTIG